jgi:hypothetical protein
MANRIETFLTKALFSFVSDALPRKAVDDIYVRILEVTLVSC